jgi:hypothetical protein
MRYLLRHARITIAQFVSICAVAILVLALFYLAVTGRLHWLFALTAAALPFARRLLPLLRFIPFLRQLAGVFGQSTGHARQSQSGNRSDIQTRFLSMELDHDTGSMDGRILTGQFKGDLLSELNSDQLCSLLAECRTDTDSVNVLEAYLDRIDPAWREWERRDSNGGDMNERQALEILGLESGASREEIIDAHRHLMQKLHPDRGGSTYLAAKLNGAKDYLLG